MEGVVETPHLPLQYREVEPGIGLSRPARNDALICFDGLCDTVLAVQLRRLSYHRIGNSRQGHLYGLVLARSDFPTFAARRPSPQARGAVLTRGRRSGKSAAGSGPSPPTPYVT